MSLWVQQLTCIEVFTFYEPEHSNSILVRNNKCMTDKQMFLHMASRSGVDRARYSW